MVQRGKRVGAGTSRLGPVRAGGGGVPRKAVVRGAIGIAVAAAVVPAAALVGRAFREPHDDEKAAGADFEETYRGRHIRGERGAMSMRAHADASGAHPWNVTVDGRPLHLMRRADGTYLSMVDHYQSYATPLGAARGAVDELGDQMLRRDAL
ncbi:tyrosinase family oxidase copper chaperone [Streptomyces sp. NPDC046821]|uniref:tyrosinase family oxidase copper chaperone n=1 Tax=Streptomyces sp. NPDC046821 TaxID=3154702 RepID=UPI003406FD2D